MNLFYLDEGLDKCAEYHVDKHVNKMILEAGQILCTNMWIDKNIGCAPRKLTKDENALITQYRKDVKAGMERHFPYMPTMQNHPSTVWARTSIENHYWTHCYAHALAEEYRYRYGKSHKSFWEVINKLPEPQHMPDAGFTTFGLAMPEELKDYDNPIQSYRDYYHLDKATFASWKFRARPDWWCDDYADYEKRITAK